MFSKEDFPFVMIEVLQSGHYDHGIDKVWREGDDICENKEVVFRPVEPLERIVCWRRTKSSITVGAAAPSCWSFGIAIATHVSQHLSATSLTAQVANPH